MKRYEQIPHTSDIAIRVYGKNIKELFGNAAYGMFDILADLEGIKISTTIDISIKAPSKEELLVSWMDELLYNFYSKNIIFSKFNIEKLENNELNAKASGQRIGHNRNRLKKEIKAITYHDLHIKENSNGLTVEIVLDV
jgi:SHS2 domain-containing protein